MKLYGLIGYPLGHSFSKKYFTNKFESERLGDCYFELFPLKNIRDFPGLLEKKSNLNGLAVTIPYKELILPFLDSVSHEATIIGAVNCIQFKNGFLFGHNTDVVGFEKSFLPLLQSHHQKALILGTGGASKAVQYILNKHHIPFTLVSRTEDVKKGIINYESVSPQIMSEHLIIINCSPVGMVPNQTAKPAIPYQCLSNQHYLYDLVYGPQDTAFLTEGRSRGADAKDGYEMLELQAEENWRIWNSELQVL